MSKNNYLCGAFINISCMKDGTCEVTFMDPLLSFDPLRPHHVFATAVGACVFILEEMTKREKEASSVHTEVAP
jgi:hypothetical protein